MRSQHTGNTQPIIHWMIWIPIPVHSWRWFCGHLSLQYPWSSTCTLATSEVVHMFWNQNHTFLQVFWWDVLIGWCFDLTSHLFNIDTMSSCLCTNFMHSRWWNAVQDRRIFLRCFFFVRIKIQAPCVQNNVHCICHSMFGRCIIISKRMMRMF